MPPCQGYKPGRHTAISALETSGFKSGATSRAFLLRFKPLAESISEMLIHQ